MFDWLFEKRVKGTLFFKSTCKKYYENLYDKPYDYLDEVRGITLASENEIVGLRYRMFGLIPERYYEKCRMYPNANLAHIENAEEIYENGGEVEFRIEVECWEGAWKKLEKLPWVTGTAKAC